ncbi:nuclear transport factor 2 family protein [Microcoleus sp. FACHB-1515]|uniref:nuclear transport factor 2 family protein n=1 Tax=Cyanophyceae TaxID=3028117 RepID=UPI001686C3F5|nr:nuclear transport factor 2 family protein [Microcoleus sp. FACHB-1515]MBD2090123.1 nuclear transport factor 2 family protein [Microcoleus sp. FACHB-1515]
MQDAIAELEERLRQAMLASDVAALDELIADDLVFTLPTGALANKQMDLDAHRSGSEKLTAVKFLERQVQIYDKVAIVTVKTELAGTYEGENLTGTYRYTRVWAQPQGRWQIVAGHVSRVL